MKPRVYVETSVVSYLTAEPSRDMVAAARQALTREWWAEAAERYELVVSSLVRREAAAGDSTAAGDRLDAITGLEVWEPSPEADRLAEELLLHSAVPAAAAADALHIAIAAAGGADYLLTWNCKHIANAHLFGKIAAVCEGAGLRSVTICTPEELMEAPTDD